MVRKIDIEASLAKVREALDERVLRPGDPASTALLLMPEAKEVYIAMARWQMAMSASGNANVNDAGDAVVNMLSTALFNTAIAVSGIDIESTPSSLTDEEKNTVHENIHIVVERVSDALHALLHLSPEDSHDIRVVTKDVGDA